MYQNINRVTAFFLINQESILGVRHTLCLCRVNLGWLLLDGEDFYFPFKVLGVVAA